MGQHDRLRALAAERIDWPAGPGIVIDANNTPVIGDDVRAPHVGSLLWELYDARPCAGREVEAVMAANPRLTAEQAAQGLAYGNAHEALFGGHAWREWMDNNDFPADSDEQEAFMTDLRALLADRDAAVALLRRSAAWLPSVQCEDFAALAAFEAEVSACLDPQETGNGG